jgi:hypothetical protein
MIRSWALSETESLLPGYDQNLRVYSSAVTSCIAQMEYVQTQLEKDQGVILEMNSPYQRPSRRYPRPFS